MRHVNKEFLTHSVSFIFVLITAMSTGISIPSAQADNRGTTQSTPIECFQLNQTTLVGYNDELPQCTKEIVIPNSVTQIGKAAFVGVLLTSVVIPNSVTQIGESAFAANQLTSVVLPNSVTQIGEYAFCFNPLSSILIPKSVNEIGEYAFSFNQLKSVVVPNSVSRLDSKAFDPNVQIIRVD